MNPHRRPIPLTWRHFANETTFKLLSNLTHSHLITHPGRSCFRCAG